MQFSALRRMTRSTLMCACALVLLITPLAAQPAHAEEAEAKIDETVTVDRAGQTHYDLSLHDYSKTITEDMCTRLPHTQEWSRVSFTTNEYAHSCSIRTDFNRNVNPYVGVDSSGHVTFAARPVTAEDLNAIFPDGVVLKHRNFTLGGFYFKVSTATGGASLETYDQAEYVHWYNHNRRLLGAEGQIQVDQYFHTQDRQDYNDITAAPMPSDLRTPPPSGAPTQWTNGSTNSSNGSNNLFLKLLAFVLIPVFLGAKILVDRVKQKRRHKKRHSFMIPEEYQPRSTTPTSVPHPYEAPGAPLADPASPPTSGPRNPYSPSE